MSFLRSDCPRGDDLACLFGEAFSVPIGPVKLTASINLTMRTMAATAFLLIAAIWNPALAEPNPANGQQLFVGACSACHSLEPNKNFTGPSLSGLWGRKAGSLSSFPRYSPAIKSANVVWDDQTLDKWIANPKALIPENRMSFPGLPSVQERADLIAFLKKATQPGKQTAQAMQGMMGMNAGVPNLKSVAPESQVKEIRYCGDTYTITTADGHTHAHFLLREQRRQAMIR